MQEYCLGFCFIRDVDKDNLVVLIHKQRPDWQKGKLNGVGGKIEIGENPYQSMKG